MSSHNDERNVISSDRTQRHVIVKYDFKVIDPDDVVDTTANLKVDKHLAQDLEDKKELQKSLNTQDKSASSSGEQLVQTNPNMDQGSKVEKNLESYHAPSPIDNGLIEKLLSKHEELAQTLASVQNEIRSQQSDFDTKLENERERALKEGYDKGALETKERYEVEIEELKRSYLESIEQITKESGSFSSSIDSIEKELSSIAIDIAKEIVTLEVKERSSEIAHSLSKALMENLKDATKIRVKVSPVDFAFLKEQLVDDERVKVEADKAIAKGGVVIISDKGNVDGTILSRYQTLKRSILEQG